MSTRKMRSPGRAPARNRNGVPAYQRIQGVIRKRIDSGQLQPGDAVASERDLAKIHQVSLMTARHALASHSHSHVEVVIDIYEMRQ